MLSNNPTNQEKEFARKIKELRLNLGYSLEEAGNEIGVSKAVLYKFETNETMRIPLDKIEAIAKAYDVSPTYLCGWSALKNNSKHKSKFLTLFKEVGQGVLASWSGLTTGFILALFTGSTAIAGVSAIGIITLYIFLTLDTTDEYQKKKYMNKFRKKKLLLSMPEIIKENYIYEKFRGNCFFTVGLKDEITTWKHRLLDLLLKTFYFIAHLVKEDKIDEFIEIKKDNDFNEKNHDVCDNKNNN